MKKRMKTAVMIIIVLLLIISSGCRINKPEVEIMSVIDNYSPMMSSVPGFPLKAIFTDARPDDIIIEWKTGSGTFLNWGGDMKVVKVGDKVEFYGDIIYWSPFLEDASITDAAAITLTIRYSDSRKLIAEDKKWIRLNDEGMFYLSGN